MNDFKTYIDINMISYFIRGTVQSFIWLNYGWTQLTKIVIHIVIYYIVIYWFIINEHFPIILLEHQTRLRKYTEWMFEYGQAVLIFCTISFCKTDLLPVTDGLCNLICWNGFRWHGRRLCNWNWCSAKMLHSLHFMLQWNLSVTTTSIIRCITSNFFSNVL